MNRLKMDIQQAINTLSRNGWSQRRIARELNIDRETVARYHKLAREAEAPKPAISPAGSKPGRVSHCEPYKSAIEASLDRGLSAQRIYQDLVTEQQFAGSYDSVKRFVRQLEQGQPLPFRRLETEPGQEAQVDFGQGAWVVENGKRRRPHVLRVVLSHSRKGYTEVFWRQNSENFIRGLENAFRHFGGVPSTLVIDNLRAAVKKVDWFEPELNPKVVSFCEHYGTVILPTKPAMPRHKGKVEAGVDYVQENALAGKQFGSLAGQNLHLAHWEATVADTRIHGTTRRQVGKHFLEAEKPALRPLPASLFPCFREAPRKVHRDGYVEIDKAYYSAPPEYVRRSVWARWDAKMVRLFNDRMQPIAVHVRAQAGKFQTDPAHIHDHKRTLIERGADWILDRCRLLGPGAGRWAEGLYQQRGPECLRVLQGLLALAEKHSAPQIDQACQLALSHGAGRLREVRQLLARPVAQEQFGFIETHPLIRDLKTYDNLVPVCFRPASENKNNHSPCLTHEHSQP